MAAKVTAVAWTTKPTLELSKSPKLAAKSVSNSIRCRFARADEHRGGMQIEGEAIGVPQHNTRDYHLA